MMNLVADEANGATEYWPGTHLAAHTGVLSDRWPTPVSH